MKNLYQKTALWLLNLLLVFTTLNLFVYALYLIKDAYFSQNPVFELYGKEKVMQAYRGKKEAEVEELLQNTWGRQMQYHPFAAFTEKAYRSRWVNIHPAGFRYGKNQGIFPLDSSVFNIFLFGGSSAFGYGVPDEETISSQLQSLFEKNYPKQKIRCYNFGSAFHYSSQERVFFEDILSKGHLPDAVLFLDGLNEFFFEQPFGSEQMEKFFELSPSTLLYHSAGQLPLLRAFQSFQNRFFSRLENLKAFEAEKHILDCIRRYQQNRKLINAIASGYQISVFFFWMPVSCYQYPEKYRIFKDPANKNCFPASAYRLMEKKRNEIGNTPDFCWLADSQTDPKENLYVDAVHFSSHMNALLAWKIFQHLQKNCSVLYLDQTAISEK